MFFIMIIYLIVILIMVSKQYQFCQNEFLCQTIKYKLLYFKITFN